MPCDLQRPDGPDAGWRKAVRTRICVRVLGSLALRFALDFSGKTRHLALWVLQMRDHLYTLLLQQ